MFLLPDAFTKPDPAILPAALSDPDSPADLRPDDPDDEEAWWAYFEQVVRDYVRERFAAPENASADEMLAAEKRVTKEMTDVVTYYEQVRTRERAIFALQHQQLESGEDFQETNTEPATKPLRQSEDSGADRNTIHESYSRYFLSDYAGQSWREGGIGVDISSWPKLPIPGLRTVG